MTFRGLARWAFAATAVMFMVRLGLEYAAFGTDSHAYWLAPKVDDLYRTGPATEDAYLYSPAFAQAMTPLSVLPWRVFSLVYLALQLGALYWLVRPLAAPWAISLAALCVPELLIGNINIFLALMVALMIRWPGVLAFGVLTKVTPGLMLLWFLARGEIRPILRATAVTFVLAGVSALAAPTDWMAWFTFLVESEAESGQDSFALLPRIIGAALIVVVGARTDRPWVLAVAVLIASPVLNSLSALSLLAAVPRLVQQRRSLLSDRKA